jgi:lysozyme
MRAAICFAIATLAAGCAAEDPDVLGEDSAEVRICSWGSTVEGIDVSKYQGTIDWKKVKQAGIQFAFIRVSDGLKYPDGKFAANWTGARAAGVLRGAYQFFRPGQDAVAQADLLLDAIGTLGDDDLPPVIDVEVTDGQTPAVIIARVREWVDRIETATGRKPIVYSYYSFWQTSAGKSTAFSDLPLWIANYGVACPSVPPAWPRWAFFQYTGSGTVPGVPVGVDRNRFNGDLAALRAFTNSEQLPSDCSVAGKPGMCIDNSTCVALGQHPVPGYCPGPWNIQCCLPGPH